MRITLSIDDALATEACSLTGAKTTQEVVQIALEMLVKRRRKKNLLDLAGKIRFRDDFDHKSLRT